jgi:hypothetical protein
VAEQAGTSKHGHYLGSRDIEIWKMAKQANQTAKQSYGQKVERTIKNKDLRLSKEDLIKHLKELLEEKGDRCAISGILLQYDGPDPQLRPLWIELTALSLLSW